MRIYLLKQIESGEATDNVRRSIKEGERLKNFYKQTFLNIFEPLLASQGQTKDTIVEGFDAIFQRLGRYLDSNEAERAKLASERAKKKGIQQIQESTAQALGEPITQPTSIQKAVEEGKAKIQQAAVEKRQQTPQRSLHLCCGVLKECGMSPKRYMKRIRKKNNNENLRKNSGKQLLKWKNLNLNFDEKNFNCNGN